MPKSDDVCLSHTLPTQRYDVGGNLNETYLMSSKCGFLC